MDIKKGYMNIAKLGLATMITGITINLYGFSEMMSNYFENGSMFGVEQSSDYHQKQDKTGHIQLVGLLAALGGAGATIKGANGYKGSKNLEGTSMEGSQ